MTRFVQFSEISNEKSLATSLVSNASHCFCMFKESIGDLTFDENLFHEQGDGDRSVGTYDDYHRLDEEHMVLDKLWVDDHMLCGGLLDEKIA